MKWEKRAVIGLVVVSLVVISIFGGRALGGTTISSECENGGGQEVYDPWAKVTPDPVMNVGYIDLNATGRNFTVEGYIDGIVVFAYPTGSGLLLVQVDGNGTILWAYRFPEGRGGHDISKLSNGNILYQQGGTGIYEISEEGEIVWFHPDPWNSHHAQRLDNGNTVIVECGRSYAYEIDYDGNKVWEWDARDEIPEYNSSTFIGFVPPLSDVDKMENMYEGYREGGRDWTHINTAFRTDENTTILCLRNFDLLLEVDMDNNVVWSFGPMVLKHPHDPTRLDNGNTLVFDNGNGRVIEVSPSHEIVWEYSGFNSPVMGGCQRLPDGNTLICVSQPEGVTDPYILVVSPEGEVIWKLTVPRAEDAYSLPVGPFGGPYRAKWYPS